MHNSDLEAGIHEIEFIEEDQTQAALKQKFLFKLAYILAAQVVYEYYTTFNLLVFATRLLQLMLIFLTFIKRRFRRTESKKVVFGLVVCLSFPVLFFQLVAVPSAQPIVVVIVGKVQVASLPIILLNDGIISLLVYILMKEQGWVS